MSKKVKVVLNRNGVKALLKSKEMQGVCNYHAAEIRDRCGEGYGANSHVGKNRCNASVFPQTYEAKRDNLENNTILKAVR